MSRLPAQEDVSQLRISNHLSGSAVPACDEHELRVVKCIYFLACFFFRCNTSVMNEIVGHYVPEENQVQLDFAPYPQLYPSLANFSGDPGH